MGARPIATLNSIHFGDTNHPKTKNLLNGVSFWNWWVWKLYGNSYSWWRSKV